MDFSKGKLYEFSGLFRRDRQYFDYDLLGNPNIPAGGSIPIGPSNNPVGHLAWPQVPAVAGDVQHRAPDDGHQPDHLPLSKVTFRVGFSQNIFQGPSLSPGESVGKYDALLEEYQRNSTDDFLGAVDWKPWQQTKFTFEEQVDHYKADSYFVLAPQSFLVQEADGTPVSLGNWTAQRPYGIAGCNTGSMGSGYTSATNYTILSPAQYPGGKPVINPACSAITSYLRSQPTRTLYPTETFRFQSSSIKNLAMNGDFRYTKANSNLPNYYENWNGLMEPSATPPSPATQPQSGAEVVLITASPGSSPGRSASPTRSTSPTSTSPAPPPSTRSTTTPPTTVVPGNNGYETSTTRAR